MNNIKVINWAILGMAFTLFACESSEDVSMGLDHTVPDCKSLTFVSGSQTVHVDDAIVPQYFWGFVPQNNLQEVTLPTITVSRGSTFKISMQLSDNVALRSLQFVYDSWLFSDYINFANPVENIPLTPQSYLYEVNVTVPNDAVATPWIESYYFKDGLQMKVTQPYHKFLLTLVDVNMNKRLVPIYVKVI